MKDIGLDYTGRTLETLSYKPERLSFDWRSMIIGVEYTIENKEYYKKISKHSTVIESKHDVKFIRKWRKTHGIIQRLK